MSFISSINGINVTRTVSSVSKDRAIPDTFNSLANFVFSGVIFFIFLLTKSNNKSIVLKENPKSGISAFEFSYISNR